MEKNQGEEVFHPFGFDSFGIPIEQYAEKVGRSPQEVTKENIENFKKNCTYLI
jgi:leucyl-tRNA synthetase